MRLIATFLFIFCLTSFLWTGSATARERVRPPKYQIGCNCFARTVDNPHSDHFGHVYGWGDTIDDAYDNAEYNCENKRSILNEGGATWISVQRCVTIED